MKLGETIKPKTALVFLIILFGFCGCSASASDANSSIPSSLSASDSLSVTSNSASISSSSSQSITQYPIGDIAYSIEWDTKYSVHEETDGVHSHFFPELQCSLTVDRETRCHGNETEDMSPIEIYLSVVQSAEPVIIGEEMYNGFPGGYALYEGEQLAEIVIDDGISLYMFLLYAPETGIGQEEINMLVSVVNSVVRAQ